MTRLTDADLLQILDTHKYKILQLGAPLRTLSQPFSIESKVLACSYLRSASSQTKSRVAKETQLEWWEGIINFECDPKDGITPVFVLSGKDYDSVAVRKGIEAMASFLHRGYKPVWYTLTTGYQKRSDIHFPSADVLFISNIVSSSTPHKLELLRDVLMVNHHCLRIVMTAGWNGKELSNAIQLSINGLIHMKSSGGN